MYPNYGPTGLVANSVGCVAPFVCWIKDNPLPDGLKIPSHVGSYYGKEDLDNYLLLFKGAIHMQKWAMLLPSHIFVHGLKTRSLVEFLFMDLPTTYKGLMEKIYTWIEAKEVATNGAPNDHKEGFDMFGKDFSWDNSRGKKKNQDRVDSKIPLIGFSGEHSWPLREVPLEVTVGENPYTRMETLNFVIVKYNSPYNLLLGRTVMQKMGILVSTIHAAIKFHTHCGISTVFSTYEPNKVEQGQKRVKETIPEVTKDLLSCVGTEERIIVNDRIPRTIMVGGKPLNMEHKLNEYKHIELVKQKKCGLALE
nr:reverse transcriptase domain-containing protein [Tanacetum cinerariifolium]